MKRLKDLLIIICITIILLIGLETVCRILVKPRESRTYKDHQNIIDVLGIPALNDIMESDPYLFWNLKRNIMNYHIKGRIGRIFRF